MYSKQNSVWTPEPLRGEILAHCPSATLQMLKHSIDFLPACVLCVNLHCDAVCSRAKVLFCDRKQNATC